ncbi:hypothetical protein F2P81_014041 [Scophthalmus maximus]|uniref:Uncharacterized protein n=1 Tax=Scophthalmus maximus TaxID=52904 RepID=A0A6A4SN20_SCOMX|nr:hypothetical protein F2P81_014041 [Scophthalmus maximus]
MCPGVSGLEDEDERVLSEVDGRGERMGMLHWVSPPISQIDLVTIHKVSDDSSDSPEPGPVTCMEPFQVRRLSCRTVQLPPLAFRQAEQYYCDRKLEPDTVTVPPRPTTLPLRTPPLIAITSADSSSESKDFDMINILQRFKIHKHLLTMLVDAKSQDSLICFTINYGRVANTV